LSPELQRAKARYAANREAANRGAVLKLVPHIGVQFSLANWTNRAREAYEAQWLPAVRHPDGNWDWPGIFNSYRDLDRFDLVIWGPDDRLSGLCLGTCQNNALKLQFIEGDPRPDCPLIGRRILICLEAAARYAQARGKAELRLQPVNSSLESLYRDTYGFALEKPPKLEPYYRKGV
jgi:hypothetical protein